MKRVIKESMIVLIGNFILAIGVACFIVPNEVLSGGVAGISVALHPLLPQIPVSMMITIITYVLFAIGTIALGKDFFLKTLLSTLSYPVFLNILTYFMQDNIFTESTFLASLYSGIFVGLGVGLVFRIGGSTGGMDIPALIVHKWTNLPLSSIVLVIDGLTVILGVTTHSVEAAMIGLISVWSSTYVMDKAISFGGEKMKSMLIISPEFDKMIEAIHKDIDRGVTILDGEGGYTREKKKVLMVVVTNKQLPHLKKLIMNIDPNAFIIVQDAQEIEGNGFTIFLDD